MAGALLRRCIPAPVAKFHEHLRPHLPERSFITVHYTYFICTCMVSSLIIWGSATPFRSVSYTDSLFLAVSAMTLAGLNTVNLSTLNTFQQFMLFLLIILGSAILVSSVVVHVRKKAFQRKLESIILEKHNRRHRSFPLSFSFSRPRTATDTTGAEPDGMILRGRTTRDHPEANPEAEQSPVASGSFSTRPSQTLLPPSHDLPDVEQGHGQYELSKVVSEPQSTATRVNDHDTITEHIRFQSPPPHERHHRHTQIFSGAGVGAFDLSRHPRNASQSTLSHPTPFDDNTRRPSFPNLDKYIKTVNGLVGRNSQFYNLSVAEREELGGLEYQAVSLLSIIVPAYFVTWQLIGAIGCGTYINLNRPSVARTNGLNPYWVGAFFAISAFNNSGMALLDANMTAFQTSYYMLLTMSLLILAGNTCYPPFLRLVLWTMKNVMPDTPKWQEKKKVVSFILDHPRRTYTHLFPSRETWYLVFTVVVLNGIDWFAFCVLDIGNKSIESIPERFRVLDGLFQAFAIRSGGFYVFAIPDLRPGLLVLYVLMMYISVYPVTMAMRNTNTYEERSLGVYADQIEQGIDVTSSTGRAGGRSNFLQIFGHGFSGGSSSYFIRQQLHGQLAHDLWWLALAVLFITIVETGQFERDPTVFSIFNIMFEVVSGYGCVGVSTGVPWAAYSFCGSWHVTSKLILCAVMLRGRHRGLPVAIDKAILLPDKTLAWAEEEDAQLRLERSLSRQRTGLKES